MNTHYECLICGAPTEAYGPFDSTGPLCRSCWEAEAQARHLPAVPKRKLAQPWAGPVVGVLQVLIVGAMLVVGLAMLAGALGVIRWGFGF